MTDVACVFHALLHVQGVRRAAETAAGRVLSPVDIARLCVLCFLHDIGKANAGFQVRYWSERSKAPPGWYASPFGHGPQGWAVLIGKFHDALRVRAGLPLNELISWGDACETLLHASISHHGRPVIPDGNEPVWKPVLDGGNVIYDPADTVVAVAPRERGWSLVAQCVFRQVETALDSPRGSRRGAPCGVQFGYSRPVDRGLEPRVTRGSLAVSFRRTSHQPPPAAPAAPVAAGGWRRGAGE